MTDTHQDVPKAKMTTRERHLRSQLAQILSSQAMTKGSLLYREKVCGNPTCKCAKGQGHPTLCLVVREGGRQKQVFVPQPLHTMVKEWVACYQKAKELQEEICKIYLKKLQKREV